MNLSTWKMYIGQTIDLESRWKHHLQISNNSADKNHQLIHKAIAKYGRDTFIFVPLQAAVNYQEVLDAEKYWIDFYQTNTSRYGRSAGYNLTDGGEGWFGKHHTEESKLKISLANTGKIHSESFKENRRTWYAGEGNPMYGKHHTNKSLRKISSTRKAKGLAKGTTNPKAKLTEEQVREIKLLLKEGKLQQKEIAKLYNVWSSAIQKIASGKNWWYIVV